MLSDSPTPNHGNSAIASSAGNSSSSTNNAGSPYAGCAPYKAQRQTSINVRERKRVMRSAPNG